MIVEFSNPKIIEHPSLGKVYNITAVIGPHFYDNCTIIRAAVIDSKDYTDRFTFPTASIRKAYVDFTQQGYTYDSPLIHTDTLAEYSDGKGIDIYIPIPTNCSDIPIVYLECSGNVSPDCPCGEDKLIDCIPCINWEIIYKRGFMVLETPNCGCEIPQLFVDYIIMYNGVKTAFNTKKYTKMISLYNQLLKSSKGITVKSCNCHA